MSFDLEPLTREHVKRMAPNQKKNPTKKTKRTVKKGAPKKNPTKKTKKTVKKGAPKQAIEKQLEKMGKRHEKIEMQYEKLEEKMEERQEKMEEQVEELKEKVEKKHDELKDKMEEDEESSSEESEDEDDEGSTSSSSDEEDGWLRGKLSGLFGSRTHFGSAHNRQVQIQDLFADFFSPSPGAGRQWEWERRLQQKDGSKAKDEPNEESQEDC